jgi:hypothetical protein
VTARSSGAARGRRALVRVPPKLTAPERRPAAARQVGPIDALAVARARCASRARPARPGRALARVEAAGRSSRRPRRRAAPRQQRLRWHLHELDRRSRSRSARSTARPGSSASAAGSPAASRRPGADRARAGRPLPLASPRDRSSSSASSQRDAQIAPALLELPGCGALTAAKLLARSARSSASKRRPARPPRRRRPLEASSGRSAATGSTAAATASSTARCTGSRHAGRVHPAARAYLERKQARQEPPRGDPLPQTPARTRRLQHLKASPS